MAAALGTIAVFDGLLLELMSTGDQRRVTKALDYFVSMASKQIHAPVASSPA